MAFSGLPSRRASTNQPPPRLVQKGGDPGQYLSHKEYHAAKIQQLENLMFGRVYHPHPSATALSHPLGPQLVRFKPELFVLIFIKDPQVMNRISELVSNLTVCNVPFRTAFTDFLLG
jgi:hypothetical protein